MTLPAESTDWDRFPVAPMSRGTFLKRAAIHADLVLSTRRRTGAAGVLEVGVGSGAQSALLSRRGVSVTTVDNDARILGVARENLRRFGAGARPLRADAFQLPFASGTFGVALSQGLMEHFADERIAALLREQLRVARSVVFSVPSAAYPRQDVGNERLMSPDVWQRIVSKAISPDRYRIRARGYRIDLEALKHSLLRRRWEGSYSVLVTVDPR